MSVFAGPCSERFLVTVSKRSKGERTLKIRVPSSLPCAGGQVFPLRQPPGGGARSRKARSESLAGHWGQAASKGALSKGSCHWNSGTGKYSSFVPKVIHPAELLTQPGSLGVVACTVEELYHRAGRRVTVEFLTLEIRGLEP